MIWAARHRITDASATAPVDTGANVILGTIWLTLVIGIVFVIAGVRVGQLWLAFWGVLSVFAALAYSSYSWVGRTGQV